MRSAEKRPQVQFFLNDITWMIRDKLLHLKQMDIICKCMNMSSYLILEINNMMKKKTNCSSFYYGCKLGKWSYTTKHKNAKGHGGGRCVG